MREDTHEMLKIKKDVREIAFGNFSIKDLLRELIVSLERGCNNPEDFEHSGKRRCGEYATFFNNGHHSSIMQFHCKSCKAKIEVAKEEFFRIVEKERGVSDEQIKINWKEHLEKQGYFGHI